MSIEAIKQELASLDLESRNEIVAYLVSIDDQDDVAYRASLSRKLDDKNPDHWLTIEELDRRLGIKEDESAE